MKLLEQFKQAVRYGRGEAFQILQKHPELPVDDFLIESALHNVDYNPQCSGNRSLYIDELLELRPNYHNLLSQIAERFADDETLYAWDAEQVYELLLGNTYQTEKIRSICYKRFAEKFETEADTAFAAICDNDGQAGVLFVARTYGKKLLDDPEYCMDNCWISSHLEGAEYDYNWREFLQQYSYEPEIKIFLQRCVANFDEIDFDHISQHKRSEAEQQQLEQDFVSETDIEKLKIICTVLIRNKRVKKQMFAKLASLTDCSDKELAFLAIEALKHIPCKGLRELAVVKVKNSSLDWKWVSALAADYTITDAQYIYSLFKKYKSQDIRHNIISELLQVKNIDPELLFFLYRRCSCGFCRTGLIEKLCEQDAISEQFAAELCHESQLDIRAIAEEILQKSKRI